MSITIQDSQLPTTASPINGTKTAPTSSAEAISGSIPCKRGVLVIADRANTGVVYVGGSSVTTSNGVDLEAREGRFYETSDAANIYCISSTSSQIIRYEVL